MIGDFLKLIRFDKPIGTILLWVPTAWALWIASNGHPPLNLITLFALGTVLMRSAGCIINDLTDKDLDAHISRTKNRVLVNKKVSSKQALTLLFILLLIAAAILLMLPKECILYAILAMLITIIYPWGKRFIAAPQLILSLAFSMGMPMAWVASGQNFNTLFYTLFFMNILWVIAYDTQYAMVDRPDDLKHGIKSTAILFGKYDVAIIISLLIIMHLCWLLIIKLHYKFIFLWLMGLFIIIYQYNLIKNRQPSQCLRAFNVNGWYGLLTLLYLLAI